MIIMKITLKDGSFKEYEGSMSVLDITKDISEGLARVATSARVNGEVVDLRHVVDEDCELEILTFDNEEGKGAFWHTTSHIMAQAIKRLYPDTKLAIGPSIENGFYYDVDRETPFAAEDLEKIEKEMKKIVKEALPIERFTKTREDAIAYFKEKDEPYKVELIEDLPEGEEISFYQQGEFVDLCAGPHLMTTKPVKAFKLTSLAGAYWRGSEKNKMLTRIYGISYPKKAQLDEYLTMLEEAKKRDHRKLGKELGLFMMCEEGPGFPFFLPKGMVLKNTLLDYWRELHKKAGYVEVSTPVILSRHLWETSGHWDHYKENMYTTQIDGEDFAIKPMNCPGGMLVYKAEPRSYKDLPLRVGELGLVHRHEKSGQLHGLMRVRCFTQDDAHIFMMPEQIRDEIKGVVALIDEVYQLFGFKYHVELSTCSKTSAGSFWVSPMMRKLILFFIKISSSIESMRRLISAATSSTGRFQFSVEKVYSVRYLTPKRAASSAMMCTVSAPAWWPKLRICPRCLAHLPLPSMMMATWAGTRLLSICSLYSMSCSGFIYFS